MGFNKNREKETINILLQENKRLKRENRRLHESLDELQKYKEEYRNLIAEVNQIKKWYQDKGKDFDNIYKEYQDERDKLLEKK